MRDLPWKLCHPARKQLHPVRTHVIRQLQHPKGPDGHGETVKMVHERVGTVTDRKTNPLVIAHGLFGWSFLPTLFLP